VASDRGRVQGARRGWIDVEGGARVDSPDLDPRACVVAVEEPKTQNATGVAARKSAVFRTGRTLV
jgi:hypothetical protein